MSEWRDEAEHGAHHDGWDSPARKEFIHPQAFTPLAGFIQAHHPQVTQTVMPHLAKGVEPRKEKYHVD